MAERIADIDDEGVEDWPELEDELVPDDDLVPDAGPFKRPFAFLHGARVTMDSDLMLPTKVLTATAAKSILRVADETDTAIPDGDRELFERVARGDIAAEQLELVEALGEMTAFVERNLSLGDDEA